MATLSNRFSLLTSADDDEDKVIHITNGEIGVRKKKNTRKNIHTDKAGKAGKTEKVVLDSLIENLEKKNKLEEILNLLIKVDEIFPTNRETEKVVKGLDEDEKKEEQLQSGPLELGKISTISEHRKFMESLYYGKKGQIRLLISPSSSFDDEKKEASAASEEKKEVSAANNEKKEVSINVHEELLNKQSGVFSKMLAHGFQESKTKCIDMRVYEGRTVQDFVKFLYLEICPDFNYYLSRPQLLFSTIQFCQQFLLDDYRNFFIDQIKKIICNLDLILKSKEKDEVRHYNLFETFKFEDCYKSQIRKDYYSIVKFKKSNVAVHTIILNCMHFMITNYESLIQLDEISKEVESLIWSTWKSSILRERENYKRKAYLFGEWFVEVFKTEFKSWITKHYETKKDKFIDLLFFPILEESS
jgi:hypothetical protein